MILVVFISNIYIDNHDWGQNNFEYTKLKRNDGLKIFSELLIHYTQSYFCVLY